MSDNPGVFYPFFLDNGPRMTWTTVTESRFDHERRALDFIHRQLDKHLGTDYAAWSNFSFRAADGSLNEVDLLVATAAGLFLVEIKDWHGRIEGNAHQWRLVDGARRVTRDNPMLATDLKSKRFRGRLRGLKSLRARSPFVTPLVYLSAERVEIALETYDAIGIKTRTDFIEAITTSDRPLSRDTLRRLPAAAKEIGLIRSRPTIGQYQLVETLLEGEGYQDWLGRHLTAGYARRIRVYQARGRDTDLLHRAVGNEVRRLQGIQHPGILPCLDILNTDAAPAVIYDHEPEAQPLDLYLADHGAGLSLLDRVRLLRRIAETLRYAHGKGLYHRGLTPRCVLVCPSPDETEPRVLVFDWRTAHQNLSGTGGLTEHIADLVDPHQRVYLFPGTGNPDETDVVRADVFSMGALAYLVFSLEPPARDVTELTIALREGHGLDLARALSGPDELLTHLVNIFTDPGPEGAGLTMDDVLDSLTEIEHKVRPMVEGTVDDPDNAVKGSRLPGGYTVEKRLGRGARSVVLQVAKNDKSQALKIAVAPGDNPRIQTEYQTLARLEHPCFVKAEPPVNIGERLAIPLTLAGEGTLSRFINERGRLSLDSLDHFGTDLLEALDYLETHQPDIFHRDIKPDNIGVYTPSARNRKRMRLIVFDFSLSESTIDNLDAGTRGYLDPFLGPPDRPSYDLHAERFAAAVTLYQMASGEIPRWGDGKVDPRAIEEEVTIRGELFDPAVRGRLTDFFHKALARDFRARFDTAEEMSRAWRLIFAGLEQPAIDSTAEPDVDEAERRQATRETAVSAFLSARACEALERIGVQTLGDLVDSPGNMLVRLPGLGRETSRQILSSYRIFSKTLTVAPRTTDTAEEVGPVATNIDALAESLVPEKASDPAAAAIQKRVLGLHEPSRPVSYAPWPGRSEQARALGVPVSAVRKALDQRIKRWQKSNPGLTALRAEIAEILEGHFHGIAAPAELARVLLFRRGSLHVDPIRTNLALACLRAATETEAPLTTARWSAHHDETRTLLIRSGEGADNLFSFARLLGERAASLLDAGHPVGPDRVRQALEEVADPMPDDFPPARLPGLAVAAVPAIACSPRGELYPRGMAAKEALRFSQSTILTGSGLSAADLVKRVAGRYPEAEPLPADPAALQEILAALDIPLIRHGDQFRAPDIATLTQTKGTTLGEPEGSPVGDAAELDQRLDKSTGRFMALSVGERRYAAARRALCARFPVREWDLEAAFFDRLLALVDANQIPWSVIEETDQRGPGGGEWHLLEDLAGAVADQLGDALAGEDGTLLLVNAGLLARYGQLRRLEDWGARREQDGRGLWVLLPSRDPERGPRVNDSPLPVMPGHWAALDRGWINPCREVAS